MNQQTSAEARVASGRAGAVPFLVLAQLDRIPLPATRRTNARGFTDYMPGTIELDEHLMRYKGCAVDRSKFVWGLYGTAGRPDARFKSLAMAKKKRKHVLEIEGTYRLDDLDLVRAGLDSQTVLKTGFLHADRLKAPFREELKSFLLEFESNRHPRFDANKQGKITLGDLLLEHPALVQDIFDMYPRVMMLVHRVRPDWDTKSRLGVDVCTMRRTSERLIDVRVPYLPTLFVHC